MNMNNDQVRESSNSIHNFLLLAFMSIIKASLLGHKYVRNKGLRNYYVEENKDKSKLHEHDFTVSNGKDNLKVEMKTKQANGLNLQYLKENALLRTSHVLFKNSRFLLVVAIYSKELRHQYNKGDMVGFLSGTKFIMCYGHGYDHKWTELKSLNEWGNIIREADSINSLFHLISKENTRPPLTLTPYAPTPVPPSLPAPVPPSLPAPVPPSRPAIKKVKRKNKTYEQIDKAVNQAIALHDQYDFTIDVLAALVGLSKSTLHGRIFTIKSYNKKLTLLYCTFLHFILDAESITIRSLTDSINTNYKIRKKITPYDAKKLLHNALSDRYILIKNKTGHVVNSVDNTDHNEILTIEIQEKLKVLSSCNIVFKKVILA